MADDDDRRRVPVRPDAVRAAVDQAFQAGVGQARGTQRQAQELVDELAGAAAKVRETLDDLRPPSAEEVRSLRAAVEALERRIAALERSGPATG